MSNFYNDFFDKVASLPEEELLKAIRNNQHFIYEKRLKKKLGELSRQMKKKINASPHNSYKDIFLIFYKCPWLIKLSEFSWLLNKLCEMTANTHFSSSAFNNYWDAIDLVKRKFRTTKAFKPELPFQILIDFFHEVGKEERKKEAEFLKNLYKKYIESDKCLVKYNF